MTGLPGFTVDIDQNPYLPVGGRDVSAVVTVTADQTGTAPSGTTPVGGSAEIIIVDCSGSMDYPPTKLAEARAATAAAVDVIRDGTYFAIVAGTSTSWPVYPQDGSMAVAGERTRAQLGALMARLTGWLPGAPISRDEWLMLKRDNVAADAASARRLLGTLDFDLLVFDVMMPGEDGFSLARWVREAGPSRQTPVLMLTARDSSEDRITGLTLGADDYLAKPFEPRELSLRIANILKRASPPPAARFP